MNAINIAREIFPELTDEQLEVIIWEETGYPSFFDLKEGQTIIDVFKEQLLAYKKSLRGFTLRP